MCKKGKIMATLFAVLHWILYVIFKCDKLIFEYDVENSFASSMYILFLIALLIVYHCMFKVCWSVWFGKDIFVKRCIIYTFIYLVFMLILLLAVWPGAWSADDIGVYSAATRMHFLPWQHFISSIVQIISLLFIPITAGVMIVQLVIISVIIGYIISKIDVLFLAPLGSRDRKIALGLCFFPFLMFPVLLNNFSAFRAILHSYIIVLLSFKLFFMYYEKKDSSINLAFICFLAIVAGAWRTENIYYCITIPVLLGMFIKSGFSKIKYIVASCIIFIGIAALTKYNNSLLTNNNYSLVSTFAQLGELILVVDEESDKQEIEALNQVVKLEILREHSNEHGVAVHWQFNLIKDGYSDQQYKEYMEAWVKLSIKYWDVFWKDRVKHFINSMGVNKSQVTLTVFACKALDGQTTAKAINRPFNSELRKSVIRFLGCEDENNRKQPHYHIVWNVLIPLCILAFTVMFLIVKKKYFVGFILLNVLLSVGVIFITAPYYYYMYYASHYLVGYICAFGWGVYGIIQKHRKVCLSQNM